MLGFVQKLFDNNDREVKRIQMEAVRAANALEERTEQVADLAAAYAALRRRHAEGGESLDALLPEAFALARDWVAQREAADPAADGTVEHSEPQLATSPSIEARLARWSAALPPRPPVEFKPAARR